MKTILPPHYSSYIGNGPAHVVVFRCPLYPVAVCETFALHPDAVEIETPDAKYKRADYESPGMWRICKDEVQVKQMTQSRGAEVSRHRTFGDAEAALEKFIRDIGTAAVCGEWSIYQADSEEPWQSMGFAAEEEAV